MKRTIRNILEKKLEGVREELGIEELPYFEVEVPRNKGFGDYSTNIAMVLAKKLRKNPRELAAELTRAFSDPFFEKIEVAGPGFINLFLNYPQVLSYLEETARDFDRFLSPRDTEKKRFFIEYVSANPTGPLHVGHGRGACIGSSLVLILKELGHEVWQEFYINDAGAQVRNLGISILLRAQEFLGQKVEFPEGCYMGAYIVDIAKDYLRAENPTAVTEENIAEASRFGRTMIMAWIQKDLEDFGVTFSQYQSEKELFDTGAVDECIEFIGTKGLSYNKDNALWFKSSGFGDDKDRVLIKENGEKTYFASDIAYHRRKFERGFDVYINVWGADHHGYVPRILSALRAMGYDETKLNTIMVQMVSLFREGKPVTMSKRSGDFVSLREVLDEVGRDAMRFMFQTRKHDSQLDFDIELVKQKTSDNPVFYVQYMFARINSVFKVARERGIDTEKTDLTFSKLTLPEEKALVYAILSFPDALLDSRLFLEPHNLSYYLISLAQLFHSYYNAQRFINEEDMELTMNRLSLLLLLKQITQKGLSLLGIKSPERM